MDYLKSNKEEIMSALKNLLNIQKFLDSKTFKKGNKIKLGETTRVNGVVPYNVERMYSFMSDYATGKLTEKEAACKVVERIAIAEKPKFWRSKSHQSFYSYLSSSNRKIINIDIDETVASMLDFFNRVYPETTSPSKNIFFIRPKVPIEAQKIRKELEACIQEKEKGCSPAVWTKLKEVLRISYNASNMFRHNSKEKEFFSKINTFIVFKEPKHSNSSRNMFKYQPKKDDLCCFNTSKSIKEMIKKKSSIKLPSNDHIIFLDDEKKPSRLKM